LEDWTTGLILILAGGGGHTGYAYIIAEELVGKVELNFLVPVDDPLSMARLQLFGEVKAIVKPRHPRTPFYEFVPRLLQSSLQSLRRIPKNCQAVISTGSNFCIPPALISWMRGIPLVNLESADRFVKPSKTARILQHFSDVTALQWDEQRRNLKGMVFGPLLPRRKVEPWRGGYVLVASGTYGYRELLEAISRSSLEDVVIQTGGVEANRYKEKHPTWRFVSITKRFYELIGGAEVVISPPGVTALEAVAYDKPIVIVKYPEWSRAGTLEDGMLFAEKLNAPFLRCLTPEELEDAIDRAKKSKRPRLKNGARELADYIIENYVNKNN
jgi:UDP-N-acetylglucosamine--N-acetylmuramyl-(pentapeptide) pyrophosphoryl-undecaprenol N-acetylglucosamine transferase